MRMEAVLTCVACTASGATLTVDLTREVAAPAPAPLEQGTSMTPQGDSLTADSRSFFRAGQPWVPIAGEVHYSRLAREEWRDALLKMKAGGLNVAATYVFWLHHEEVRGQFDWSGQRSLRDFLTLCREVGLLAIVRMGPWCHGEARNGGFPDWVQHSGAPLRTTEPAFMSLVEPLYRETALQMKGLLWKDGGPVIGIQVDNECDNPPYLLALKALARKHGVDVPLYTMTGWNHVRIPSAGLLPVFGAYSDGFWGGTLEDYRKFFLFAPIRDDGDMGAQMNNVRPERNAAFSPFPYACAEIGPGMMSSYERRIKIDPDNVAAMALTKLGCGNNMPGYYMYHGGTNPDGKLSFLNEAAPNALPVKDYDFQTALGACGQVREQYHLLRQQHLFLQDFGPALARMPVFYPDQTPRSLSDFSTLRWSVRSDGNAGFLFFNNRQPTVPLPEHAGVQFALKTQAGSVLVPRKPATLPSGAYGVWPINLDCDGARLASATVQPLCRVREDAAHVTYVFKALDGIEPELVFQTAEGERVLRPQPSRAPAAVLKGAPGVEVTVVVLSSEDAKQLWRQPYAGRERLALTRATALADSGGLRLLFVGAPDETVALFPARDLSPADRTDGIFTRVTLKAPTPAAPFRVKAVLEQPDRADATSLKGTEEAAWDAAAVYRLELPRDASDRRLTLNLHYVGDAVRIYVGNRFTNDHFYNGDPISLALWRIPTSDWPALRIKLLPYSKALGERLPPEARRAADAARAAGRLGEIDVTATETLECRLAPSP